MRLAEQQCTLRMMIDGVRAEVTFTARQTEILRLAAGGLNAKQIGHRLRISRRTVEHHLDEARHRARTGTRAQLIAQAVEAGLVPARGTSRSAT